MARPRAMKKGKQPLALRCKPSAAAGQPKIRRKPSAASARKQPLALPSGVHDLHEFVLRFGATPPSNHRVWKKAQAFLADTSTTFQDTIAACSRLTTPTWKRANNFLRLYEAGKSVESYRAWGSLCRHRMNLQPSILASALACLAGVGVGKNPRNVIEHTYHEEINTDGSLPLVKVNTAIGVLGLTPFVVANWLYQALADVYLAFERALGAFRFGIDDDRAIGGGGGEVMLWWGTFLGAVREQAMIAWDYDVDLVCFVRPEVSIVSVWQGVCASLRPLGYQLTQHGSKYRISPSNPLAWAPYQELYQEVREHNPNLSRRQIMQQTASHWQQGQQAQQPHGKNCVDVEVYHVHKNSDIDIQGSGKYA